jgi:hypothetical protein
MPRILQYRRFWVMSCLFTGGTVTQRRNDLPPRQWLAEVPDLEKERPEAMVLQSHHSPVQRHQVGRHKNQVLAVNETLHGDIR